MRLVVSTGALTGRTLEVERRLVVGRDEGCELVLEDDEKVSRRHCAFSPNPDGTVTLEDLGSSNGTFVGGERISGPVVLRGGEEVRVGSTVLRAEGEQVEQATLVGLPETAVAAPATTVGAPATMLAGAPPPSEPPAQRPLPERPWWRSKWVLIGGVVALLAVGGIVGGVLAVTGGGDEGPVAVVTTESERSEPDTVTVTEAVETEPGPETGATETGATETGVVDAGGLTVAQQQLLTVVPPAIQPSCTGYDPTEPDLRAGLLAGLVCPLSDEHRVFYFQYESNESMDAAYSGDWVRSSDHRDQGDCSVTFPGEGTYSVGGEQAGRVFCVMGGDPVRPVIWWTTDALGVLAQTEWVGHTDRELYEFWTTEPGPNP